MKVLWLCNLMPSIIAKALKCPASNKEGWILGLAAEVQKNQFMELGIAFPVKQEENIHGVVDGIAYFGFYEDSNHPEVYDSSLESALGLICEEFLPDVIHCFGTEYPHTLAMLHVKEWKKRVLIHLQGIMELYAKVYYAGIPQEVAERATFRDILKKDTIWQQKEKFVQRGEHEAELLRLAEHVCGRTAFDKAYMEKINPSCAYYTVNETLRPEFYGHMWRPQPNHRHTIFAAQGNYPIKGIHFLIQALAQLQEDFPDVLLYVAGDNVTAHHSLKEKLKISSYGKYLNDLIKENHLENKVKFLGSLDASEMMKRYLNAGVYVIPSIIENSPNSLGEAMLLGMPCVAANVGGIASLAEDEKEVLMVAPDHIDELVHAVKRIFMDEELAISLGQAARARAMLTHDAKANYKMLCWVYEMIVKDNL